VTTIEAVKELADLSEGYVDHGVVDSKRMMLQDRPRFNRYMALLRAARSAITEFRTEFPDGWVRDVGTS
jgi:hypothetical protein